MPHVRFTRNFDWRPTAQSVQTFVAGSTKLVTTACANAAVAAGAAEAIDKPEAAPAQGIADTVAAGVVKARPKTKKAKGG